MVTNKSNHRLPAYAAPSKATMRSKQVREYVTEVVDLEEPIPDWLRAGETTDYEIEDGQSNSDSPREFAKEEEPPAITTTGVKVKRKGGKRTGTVEKSLSGHKGTSKDLEQ